MALEAGAVTVLSPCEALEAWRCEGPKADEGLLWDWNPGLTDSRVTDQAPGASSPPHRDGETAATSSSLPGCEAPCPTTWGATCPPPIGPEVLPDLGSFFRLFQPVGCFSLFHPPSTVWFQEGLSAQAQSPSSFFPGPDPTRMSLPQPPNRGSYGAGCRVRLLDTPSLGMDHSSLRLLNGAQPFPRPHLRT